MPCGGQCDGEQNCNSYLLQYVAKQVGSTLQYWNKFWEELKFVSFPSYAVACMMTTKLYIMMTTGSVHNDDSKNCLQ